MLAPSPLFCLFFYNLHEYLNAYYNYCFLHSGILSCAVPATCWGTRVAVVTNNQTRLSQARGATTAPGLSYNPHSTLLDPLTTRT